MDQSLAAGLASSANAGPVPLIQIRPGYQISAIIKGGWQLSGDHGPVSACRAVNDMFSFLEAGINTFDCADIYSGVEEMIGRFRKELHRRCGEAALSELKVHTKCVPDRDSLATLGLKDIEAGIDRSLMRLGVDRLDLVQFHWWDYEVAGCQVAMGYLRTLQEKGKINLIGVTNFDGHHLGQLCGIADVATAQVQYSLLDRRPSGKFADLARRKNVKLFAYGVLAGGFLGDAWLGQADPGFEHSNRSLVKYRLIIEEFGGWDLFQSLLAALKAIAGRHGTDVSTIAMCWVLGSQDIDAIIIGSRYADRLQQTLHSLEIRLDVRDRSHIEEILSQCTGPFGPVYGLERDATGRHSQIMKYNLNKGDHRMPPAGSAPVPGTE